jgi:glycosyltransferase 2 family protein
VTETIAGKTIGLRENLFKLRTLLGFAIAAVVIVLFLRNFNFGDALRNISSANIILLLLATAAFYSSLPLRGLRWSALLKPSGIEKNYLHLSHYYFLSWFANAILPARIGDVYRAYLLKKNDNVSISLSLGVIFSERVLDLAVTAILLVLSGSYFWATLKNASEGQYLKWGLIAITALVIFFIAVIFFLPALAKRAPEKWRDKISLFSAGIFKWPALLPKIVTMTTLIWLSEALRLYLVFLAFGVKTGFLVALFISQASLILMSLPLSPAGLGLVELLMLKLLSSANMSTGLAAAITMTDRLISYWSLLAIGGIVYLFSPRVR